MSLTKEQKDIRDTIALEILKARIQHHGIAFDDEDGQGGLAASERLRSEVNDAFCYANEFINRSNSEFTEPYDWDGTEEDRAVNREKE